MLNPPPIKGARFSREGRCSDREEINGVVKPPLTLALLSALLKAQGFSVYLSDCIGFKLSTRSLLKELKKKHFYPDVMFFPVVTPTYYSDLKTAKEIFDEFKCKTYAFGSHVTALPQESINENPFLEGVIIGEPEIAALRLCKVLDQNGSNSKNILGLYTKTNKENTDSSIPSILDDLDTLPFPDWSQVPLRNYRVPILNERVVLIETSRGCPNSCSFCIVKSIHGRRFRMKSPFRIADEIEHVMERYDTKFIDFWADNFAHNKDQVIKLCHEITRRKLGIKWLASIRVDSIDREMVIAMKNAGCWMVSIGIESCDERTRRRMSKNISQKDILSCIHLLKEVKIMVFGYFILGYPDQSYVEHFNLAKKAIDLGLDFATFYPVVPLPGTELHHQCRDLGIIKTNDWSKYEYSHYVLEHKFLNPKFVSKRQREAYLKFYLRIGFFVNLLHYFKLHQLLKGTFSNGFKFLKWILTKRKNFKKLKNE